MVASPGNNSDCEVALKGIQFLINERPPVAVEPFTCVKGFMIFTCEG